MAKKDNLIIGVDIGSYAVKVCQLLKTSQGYKLSAIGSSLIPPGAVEDGVLQNPEEVAKTISELFKNLKIKSRKIGISISGYSVIVKKVSLEKMDDDSLAEYIKNEAEQYIPFDIDDVYIDFQKLPQRKENPDRLDVMLVAAKKEIVDDYIKMLKEIKLDVVLVDVDGFALENIWETISGKIENVALVDIGASKMNINIISDGISVLARDIVVGSEQLTNQIANILEIDFNKAEKIKLGIDSIDENPKEITSIFNQTCTQWVLEIKKAIDLYSANNPEKPLQSLVLSGGGSKVNGLKQYIENETGLQVIAFNPLSQMIVESKKFDSTYINMVGPEMAIASGIAIRKSPF